MRWRMVWIVVSAVAACYALMVGLVWVKQEALVFPGAGRGRGAALPSVQGAVVEWLQRPGGERFRIARAAPKGPARGVMLYFLGNGEDLRSGIGWSAELALYDLQTIVAEYPGYGDSDGRASYDALREAAEVAHTFARARAEEQQLPLVVGGSSLGTFLAVHTAARGADRLVLLAPPTSVAEAGAHHFPWLPVRWLLRHPFDNLAAAAAVSCPALVLHGDADRVVPLEHGRRVAAALDAPLVVAPGAGHDALPLLPDGPCGDSVRAFLAGKP